MRFVPGIDYGPRKGTEGFAVHMAEGGDGTLYYLSRHEGETLAQWRERVRGVSCNFLILSTGEVVQMVGWLRASGSMNPNDRGPDSGFYNAGVIRAVLGAHYVDPNAYSLSVEITGFRSVGPNARQIDSLLGIVSASRQKFPTLRGTYGHHDQTKTKGCPGLAPEMRRYWSTVGHGLFSGDTTGEEAGGDMAISTRGLTLVSHHAVTLPPGTKVYEEAREGAGEIGEFSGPVPYFGVTDGFKAVRVAGPDGSVIGYTSTAATVWDNPPPAAPTDPEALKVEYNKGVKDAAAKAATATKP